MEAELQTYEYQLSQVTEALQADPSNEDLTTLKGELENLINLTRSLVGDAAQTSAAGGSSVAAGTSKATATTTARPTGGEGRTATAPSGSGSSDPKKVVLLAGDECLAKYKADGRYYPARITSVGGSKDDPVYSIVFKGYNNSEMVRSWEIKPVKPASSHHTSSSASQLSSSHSVPSTSSSSYPPPTTSNEKKRSSHPILPPEEEAERERKKKRSEKKSERHETKTQVAQEKASSWQKFASKKKVAKKTGGQSSMFRTPEDPLAKVGVVGAGRGMTAYQDRSKHVYEP